MKSLIVCVFLSLFAASAFAQDTVVDNSTLFVKALTDDAATVTGQPIPFGGIDDTMQAIAYGIAVGVSQELIITKSVCVPDGVTIRDMLFDVIDYSKDRLPAVLQLPPAGIVTMALLHKYKCQQL
jgi:hypothetical protein